MKSGRLALILLVMSMTLIAISVGSTYACADEQMVEVQVNREVGDWLDDLESGMNNTTTEDDSKSSLEDMVNNLFARIFGVFGDIIDFFVMIVTAPFRAWATIWGGWGSSFGEWWGPLLGTMVVIGVIVMIRLYLKFSDKLAKR